MRTLARIAALTIGLAMSLAAHAQRLGPEVALTAPQLGPTVGWQAMPHIATNGRMSLVVWADSRHNSVYAARLDARGRLLDPTGIPLAMADGGSLAVIAYRDGFIVAAGGCGTLMRYVDANGIVGRLVEVPRSSVRCREFALATNGDSILIAWRDSAEALLIDAEGTLLAQPIRIHTPLRVSVASDGRDYVIASVVPASQRMWIEATAVSRRAVAAAPQVIHETVGAFAPVPDIDVASNGHSYVIVTAKNDVSTREVAADGTLLGTNTFDGGLAPAAPRIVWTGGDYILLTGERESAASAVMNVRLRHLDAHGAPAGGASIVATHVDGYDLVPFAGTAFIVWTDGHLFGAPQFEAPALLTAGAAEQRATHIVRTRDGFVAIWLETRGASMRLLAERLTPEGGPAAAPVDIAGRDLPLWLGGVSFDAAFDGAYLVVAVTTPQVLLFRVTADLQPVDRSPLVLGESGAACKVAASDGVTIVAWEQLFPRFDNLSDVAAVRIATTERALTPTPLAIPKPPLADHAISLADAGANGFVVVWAHARRGPPSQGLFPDPPDDIVAVRVSRSGAVLDDEPRLLARSNSGASATDIAFREREYYLAWSTSTYQVSAPATYGKRVDLQLSVASTGPGDELVGGATVPIVKATGDGWLVLDGRSTVARINAGGAVEAVIRLPLAPADGFTGVTALEPLDDGRVLLAYSRIIDSADVGDVARAFTRVADISGSGPRRHASRH